MDDAPALIQYLSIKTSARVVSRAHFPSYHAATIISRYLLSYWIVCTHICQLMCHFVKFLYHWPCGTFFVYISFLSLVNVWLSRNWKIGCLSLVSWLRRSRTQKFDKKSLLFLFFGATVRSLLIFLSSLKMNVKSSSFPIIVKEIYESSYHNFSTTLNSSLFA